MDALRGQDAVVVIAPIANMDLGDRFIQAVVKARVPYILSPEFSVDTPKVKDEHSMMAPKVERWNLIEDLGVSSWITVINGFWLDVNVQRGLWGIDVKGRKVEMLKNAETKISTTIVSRSG